MLKQVGDVIKLAAVFTSGLFLGVMAGFLTAPKSGKELRKDIADETLKLKELTKDKLEEFEEVGVNKVRKAGHAIRDAADKMCLSIDELGGKSKKCEASENLPVC